MADRLLLIDEVSEMTRIPEATLRWMRHEGKAPWIWRNGRRLVAWESDVKGYLDEQRQATSISA